MQLDLLAVHCVDFDINASLALTSARIDRLRTLIEQSGQSGMWPWRFYDSYELNGQSYQIHGRLRTHREGDLYSLSIHWSRGEAHAHPDEPSISELRQVASSVREPYPIHCAARFRYGPDEVASQLPLPHAMPSMALEVRGMRLTFTDPEIPDGAKAPSVVIDRPDNTVTYHTVTFDSGGRLTLTIIREFLSLAAKLSQRFVRLASRDRRPKHSQRMGGE